MQVHCHVPIRIRLIGTPGDAELAQLSRTMAAAVAGRLEAAHRVVAERHGGTDPGGQVHERFDPGRESAAGYAVPGYDGRGAPVTVPVGGPRRPWVVLRSVHFRTTVGDFFDWVDRERP